MAEPVRRPCKACGCPLVFVVGPNGKEIPLDERTPVYAVRKDLCDNPFAAKLENAYVSHFSTCPSANRFSGGKKA